MGIRRRNMVPFSFGHRAPILWDELASNGSQPAYHDGLAANNIATGTVVGSTLVGSSFFTKWQQSLLFTPTGNGATVVLTVIGENQFGEPAREDISLALNVAVQTTNVYRRVTSIVVKSITGTPGAAATVTAGYTNVSPRLPLHAKLGATSSVQKIENTSLATQSTQPTFTVTLAPNWTINLTGTLTGVGSGSTVTVHVDPSDTNL